MHKPFWTRTLSGYVPNFSVIASSGPAFGSGTFGARYFATRPEWSAEMLRVFGVL
jgi:hypothetical protein